MRHSKENCVSSGRGMEAGKADRPVLYMCELLKYLNLKKTL